MAPADSASSSTSHIRSISSGVAARSHASSPMTNRRSGWWPMKAAKFTGSLMWRTTESLYSLHVDQSQGTSERIGASGMSSKKLNMSMRPCCASGVCGAGAIEKPQLPLIDVVMP